MSQIENGNRGGTIPYGNVLLSFRTEDDMCKTVGVATEEIPQGGSRKEIKSGDYVRLTGNRWSSPHPWCPFRSARPGAVVRVSNVSATGESIFYKTRFSPGKKWVISRDQVEKIAPPRRLPWWDIFGFASFLASFFYISRFLRSHSDLTLPHFPGGTIMHDVIMNLTNEPFVQQAVVRLSGGIAYALEAMVILLTLSMYGKRLARGLEWRRKRTWEKESRLWAVRERCDERRKKEEEEEKKERRECQDRKAAEESSRRAQEASVIAQAVQTALLPSSCHPVTDWKVWSQPAEIPQPEFQVGRFVKFIRNHDTIIQKYTPHGYTTEMVVAGDCVRIHTLHCKDNRFTYDVGLGRDMQTAPLDAVVPV